MTFEFQKCIMILGFKMEVNFLPDKKKMGRPTDCPKTNQLSIRFDNETLKTLDNYCKKENLSRVEAVRGAVRNLK